MWLLLCKIYFGHVQNQSWIVVYIIVQLIRMIGKHLDDIKDLSLMDEKNLKVVSYMEYFV